MNLDKRILLSELIKALDYDIWKDLFVPDCMEDPDESEERLQELESILDNYLAS